ncbi:MAG: hypothetical protein FJY54_04235 [Betaproteobacteria bacterium]|nr:hypothetical protein [Betaproteobacteria bacterium]
MAAAAPEAAARAARLLAQVATAGAALVLVVIVASAYLRLAQAGQGASLMIEIMRVIHRIAAATVGVLVVVIAVVCWGAARDFIRQSLAAGAIVALTLFLSVLGRATPGAELPAVTLGNLLGGMVMLGLLWWMALAARAAGGPQRGGPPPRMWGALVLLAVQIGLGALVSANQAAASCPGFPGCSGGLWPEDASLAALDPWRAPQPLSGEALAEDPVRRALHMVHRFGALILLAYWAALAAWMQWQQQPAWPHAAAACAMLAVQALLGIATALSAPGLVLPVLHNAWAALTVVVAAGAAFHSRSAEAAGVSAACQTVTSK